MLSDDNAVEFEAEGILRVEQGAGAALEVAARAFVLENGRVVLSGTAGQLADDARVRTADLGV